MVYVVDMCLSPSDGEIPLSRPVRWGIVGASRMASEFVSAIRYVEGAAVTAIAARSLEGASDFARRYAIPAACAPYGRLWDREDVDIVYVATPNSTHSVLAAEALEAGKHVLCEKPLAPTGAQAAHLFELAEAKALLLTEAFMYRYHEQTRQILAAVASGQIGDPVLVRACYRFRLDNDLDIRLRPDLQGGVLWDLGVYPVNLARAILGEPLRTFGLARQGNTGVDRSFAGILDFPADRTAAFDCSFDLPLHRSAEIVGRDGTIYVHDAFLPSAGHFQVHAPGRSDAVVCEPQNPYTEEVRAVMNSIRSGLDHASVGDDAVGNARVVAGLYEAAKNGSWTILATSDAPDREAMHRPPAAKGGRS